MTPQGAVGSNPTLSAIQFYTYSIKSSTTRRMIGRLAIATLCLNVSSTAFLYALLIDNINFSGYRTKSVALNADGTS